VLNHISLVEPELRCKHCINTIQVNYTTT